MSHLPFLTVAFVIAIATVAYAGQEECKSRCHEEYRQCTDRCRDTRCQLKCYPHLLDCNKDCEVSAQ